MENKPFENTVGKEKLLVRSNFSFSHSVFYSFGELSPLFIKLEIVVFKLFSIWKSLKFVVWERVNLFNVLSDDAILSLSSLKLLNFAENNFILAKLVDFFLSHNKPCFQCNTPITNFLFSNTCEIRFHDVIGQSTVPMYSYSKILKHGLPTWPNECFGPFLFIYLIRLIQLCDKKNLTFVDCWDKIILNSS